MKAWFVYTLARLGIFAAALAVLLLVGLRWYWAAIGAALIGLLVSYIALPGLRGQVTSNIASRRGRPERDADSDFEDDFVDAADTDATGTDTATDTATEGPAVPPVSDTERHRSRREPDAD
ncbi:DUF4229 domain-containing protein [Curtobacterium sp. MCSS17_008]|uniref:DUF4229 domain-containing protein n=1 Tax=Curtobacterium sp. MCSS17_008 TaxID=2175647 RepID=UPI000DA83364|nr:DUF4229 domain-containing protein [Curtobacterium sp. MCSS17_008]PZF58862.1 DUF4229 domain-containing protein [Curtobacterium sp. MCSS17_008]